MSLFVVVHYLDREVVDQLFLVNLASVLESADKKYKNISVHSLLTAQSLWTVTWDIQYNPVFSTNQEKLSIKAACFCLITSTP